MAIERYFGPKVKFVGSRTQVRESDILFETHTRVVHCEKSRTCDERERVSK